DVAVGGTQGREQVPGQLDNGEDVDLEVGAPRRGWSRLDPAQFRDARGVHQHVQRVDVRHRTGQRRDVGQVDRPGRGAREFGGELAEGGFVAAAEQDTVRRRECVGDGRADAA